MKFSYVAQIFEQIEKTSSRLEMTRLLADLLQKSSADEAAVICYLSLGTLNPPHIGTQFNMARKNLQIVVAALCDLSQAEVSKELQRLGDLGLVVQQCTWKADDVSVMELFTVLRHIEQISGTGSVEKKIQQLTEFLRTVHPASAKFIVRIVEGTLRLGFSDMTIVDALSWMVAGDKSLRLVIEDGYNRCADIGYIAYTVKSKGIQALEGMHTVVGIPIRPAAAERMASAADIIKKLGPCIAQPKLDGFRLQLHIDHTKKPAVVKFFSRHLTDMSHMFPDLVTELLKLDVTTMICEGEAIVYNPQTGEFLPFQETVRRKRKHGIEEVLEELPLKLFLFDLLYLNGKECLALSHDQRRAALQKVMKSYAGEEIQIIEEEKVATAAQLEDYFTQNIAAGLEGVVVKRPDAIYQPGKRNFNWIKLKRQETGQLEDTVDTVILGYYFGRGKRAHFGIGAFLVGVRNVQKDRYETVAKVGTGLKDHEWKELKKICEALKAPQQPKDVICAKELIPDVWVYPDVVCVVLADEITLSPVHSAGKRADQLGYALRFPRFMGYRGDKKAPEATTVAEIERLYKNQFKK